MDPTMTAASAVLARLNIVAELLELDIAELYALSALLAPGMGRYAHLSINGSFDQVAIRTAFPELPNSPKEVREPVAEVVEELRRRDRLFGDSIQPLLKASASRRNFVTVRSNTSDAGLSLELRSEKKESLTAALNSGEQTSGAESVASEQRLVAMLSEYRKAGGTAIAVTESWKAPAYHSRLVHGAIPASMDAQKVLAPIATELQVPKPQRGLLEDMHPILARQFGAQFAIRTGAGVIFPELHLSYRNLPMERILQMLVGLQINRNPGPMLGAFVGAVGNETPSIVTLTLGPLPPTVELAVDVTPK